MNKKKEKGNSECKMVEKDLGGHLVDTSYLELRETGRPRGICPIDSGAVAAHIPVWMRRMFSGTSELSETQEHQMRRSTDSYTPRSVLDGKKHLIHTLIKIS